MIGGGPNLIPGEISLAHLGILHLDELPEFPRDRIEALRQPLEDHYIKLDRLGQHVKYPADFMLVATMNPCPCGYRYSSFKQCTCSPSAISNYQRKLSGPLLDRIDIIFNLKHDPSIFLAAPKHLEGSEQKMAQKQIKNAIKRQSARYHSSSKSNARLSSYETAKYCTLTSSASAILKEAADHYKFSARVYFKIIKIAQTIADLDNAERISDQHISEAIQYRPQSSV